MVRDKLVGALDELFDADERAAADCFVGDQCEEVFDLIQPRALGRDEMHASSQPTCQPSLDLRVAVRGVVVDDAVHVQVGRHGGVDQAQERQELLMPMPRLACVSAPPPRHLPQLPHDDAGVEGTRSCGLEADA